MKINNILKKTALAAAIATVSFAASAGTLTIAQPTVLANEIFGNESEATSIRLPSVVFASTTTALASTNVDSTTIKLTLGGAAIFAENYQDPAAWAAQGITVTVGALNVPVIASDILDITGGTANDNQITISLKPSAGLTAALAAVQATNITLEGFKVKRLKSSLERIGDGKTPRTNNLTIEVRQAALFENTPAKAAFVSINGLDMLSTATSYVAAGGRSRIQVDKDQKAFTGATGAAAAGDFNGAAAVQVLDLGTLNVKRGQTPASYVIAPLQDAGKEANAKFDFTGGDKVFLTLSTDVPYANYGKVFATSAAACSAVAPVVADFTVTGSENSKTVEVPTSNINLDGSTAWKLCAVADGTKRIPQAEFDVALKATYFSTRYTESTGAAAYGKVLRNGCQVTLFNLPNVNAADNAFVRFTNTSVKNGEVSASVWSEEGKQLDVGAKILANLDSHATAVFHTNPAQTTGVYLGDVLPEFAASTGRSRIVLEGAFQNCEALGLIRTPNGTLTNMTSTVYSGGQNGTSNTTN